MNVTDWGVSKGLDLSKGRVIRETFILRPAKERKENFQQIKRLARSLNGWKIHSFFILFFSA